MSKFLKLIFKLKIFRFLCFCWIHKLQILGNDHGHYCTNRSYALDCYSRTFRSIKMKFDHAYEYKINSAALTIFPEKILKSVVHPFSIKNIFSWYNGITGFLFSCHDMTIMQLNNHFQLVFGSTMKTRN